MLGSPKILFLLLFMFMKADDVVSSAVQKKKTFFARSVLNKSGSGSCSISFHVEAEAAEKKRS